MSHQGILYVLTHPRYDERTTLIFRLQFCKFAIMQFIATGVWNLVQQDLISEGKLHSNGFAVLLSTLARKEINATGTCLISDQVILYVLIQTSER